MEQIKWKARLGSWLGYEVYTKSVHRCVASLIVNVNDVIQVAIMM